MVAAEAHTPLDRVRRKLEETFGAVRARRDARARGGRRGGRSSRRSPTAIAARRLVTFEYLKVGDDHAVERSVEPYAIERELPYWYVHTWDRSRDAPAHASGSTGCAPRRCSTSRSSRARASRRATSRRPTARVWYSKTVARWRLERGARRAATERARGRGVRVRPTGSSATCCRAGRGGRARAEDARAVAERARRSRRARRSARRSGGRASLNRAPAPVRRASATCTSTPARHRRSPIEPEARPRLTGRVAGDARAVVRRRRGGSAHRLADLDRTCDPCRSRPDERRRASASASDRGRSTPPHARRR